jgi:nucleoside-diphosphate-sugar epimerase
MKMKIEKILVTGANGFIGSHLIDFLINKDFEIYAIDLPGIFFKNLTKYIDNKFDFSENKKLKIFRKRIRIPTNNKKLKIVECNLKDKQLLEKLIKRTKPKFIFHFGAQALIIPSWENPIDTIETNVIGTINIFEPIKKYMFKTRIIVACTSTEFGTTANEINRPLRENDPLMAIHPYGISKVTAELLSRQYFINFGIESINLRFFNQIGPRKPDGAAADFIKKIARIDLGLAEPVIEVGNLVSYRDFMGIKDTIQAIWLAAEKGKAGETYHVCSNIKLQIKELLKTALSFSSKEIKVIENAPSLLRKTDEDIVIGDNSKIKNELGFELTLSIKEILKEMYDYWIDFYKREMNN